MKGGCQVARHKGDQGQKGGAIVGKRDPVSPSDRLLPKNPEIFLCDPVGHVHNWAAVEMAALLLKA
jgi:hypothetical protein